MIEKESCSFKARKKEKNKTKRKRERVRVRERFHHCVILAIWVQVLLTRFNFLLSKGK